MMNEYNPQDLARALFEEAGDALFLFDPENDSLVAVNPVAERLTGLPRAELLRIPATELFRHGGQGEAQRLRRAAGHTGVFHSQEGYQLRTRDPAVWIPVNITIARLHIRPRTLALMTARDIREQREAHERLKRIEAEMRRVLSSISDCVWSAESDANGQWGFRYLSPVVQKITGEPPEYFRAGGFRRWYELIHPEDRPRWEKAFARLRKGHPSQEEYRLVLADGSVRWVRDSVLPSRAEGTRALRLDGVLTDLTESKSTQEALAEERRRAAESLAQERNLLRTLMDNLPDHVFIKDTQSRFVMANAATLHTLGAGRLEDVLGKTDFDFLPRERAEQYFADEQQVIRTGEPLVNREELVIDASGGSKWCLTTKVPLRDGPAVTGLVGISHDITELKQAEEERGRLLALEREARAEAESANRAKSEFLANVSHEIRTPMNGILGMTELALDTELRPEQRDYLGMVKSSAESLLTVINDILDFSKIEAGKLELDPRPFSLRNVLGDTLKALAQRGHAKGLELACHIAPEVPDDLVGDPVRLRQVVVNLVGNAIKFTRAGEVVLDVSPAHRSCISLCATRASASRPTGSGRSSTPSSRPTARPRASTAAPGWGWRSRHGWSR